VSQAGEDQAIFSMQISNLPFLNGVIAGLSLGVNISALGSTAVFFSY